MSANKDLHNQLKVVQSITPDGDRTTTTTGDAIDTIGYEKLAVAFNYAVITDGTFTPSLTESDTFGSGYTTVDAADIEGTLTAGDSANDETTVTVSYLGSKRYVKAVITASGAPATGGKFSAVGILGGSYVEPVS